MTTLQLKKKIQLPVNSVKKLCENCYWYDQETADGFKEFLLRVEEIDCPDDEMLLTIAKDIALHTNIPNDVSIESFLCTCMNSLSSECITKYYFESESSDGAENNKQCKKETTTMENLEDESAYINASNVIRFMDFVITSYGDYDRKKLRSYYGFHVYRPVTTKDSELEFYELPLENIDDEFQEKNLTGYATEGEALMSAFDQCLTLKKNESNEHFLKSKVLERISISNQ